MRSGLILESAKGWGEAAPLPLFSKETLQETLQSLSTANPTPSASFALRCAQLPFPRSFPRIPLAALVSTLDEAYHALAQGFSTLKIKIKGHTPASAHALISKLQSPYVRLRIDVNRAWSFTNALQFFEALDPLGIEYIEEPIDNPLLLDQLPPHPIALDETLLEPLRDSLLTLSSVRALILKPTLLGDQLDMLLKEQQKQLVFSSSFESAIGLLHIAHLQAQVNPSLAAGLDTYRTFQGNFLPFPVKEGMLSDEPLPQVERSWLTPL